MANARTVEQYARRYARAYVTLLEDTDAVMLDHRAVETANAHHDLLLAVLDRCVVCDAGSCPGFVGR